VSSDKLRINPCVLHTPRAHTERVLLQVWNGNISHMTPRDPHRQAIVPVRKLDSSLNETRDLCCSSLRLLIPSLAATLAYIVARCVDGHCEYEEGVSGWVHMTAITLGGGLQSVIHGPRAVCWSYWNAETGWERERDREEWYHIELTSDGFTEGLLQRSATLILGAISSVGAIAN
jgi:hypothetical protein